MKRILTIVATLMLLPSLTVKAQEYDYEARLGWTPGDILTLIFMLGEDPTGENTYGPIKTVGIYSADFDLKMKNWLSVGAKLNYRNEWRKMEEVVDGIEITDTDRIQAISIMPTVKLTTGFDSFFRYYATLGIGAGMDLSNGQSKEFLAFQFTPVGISVGKKVSWHFEIGFGHAFTGLITGLSYRF